jgi:hypothetical protein
MQKFKTSDFKEVRDEVAIAALSAIFTGFIAWALDELKDWRHARAKRPENTQD